MALVQSDLQQLGVRLAAEPGVLAAVVHGSALTARFHRDSDVDVALLLATPTTLDAVTRLLLGAELQNLLGYTVDLGILSHDNLIYAKEVIVHGQPLFCHDQYQYDLFAATALALYGQLRFERREVEAAYAA